MVSHVGRLYAAVVGVLVLFLSWAVVAAHPWVTPKANPQLQLIALREQALRRETALVNTILRERVTTAKLVATAKQTAARQPAAAQTISQTQSAAPAPSSAGVRVVTLPPLTITKTS